MLIIPQGDIDELWSGVGITEHVYAEQFDARTIGAAQATVIRTPIDLFDGLRLRKLVISWTIFKRCRKGTCQ